jgi:hypothetical protein
MTNRTFGLATFLLAGCRTVYVADDDPRGAGAPAGGGGGEGAFAPSGGTGAMGAGGRDGGGGAGGGIARAPRTITVDLSTDRVEGVRVVVSDGDGTLRVTLTGSELPALVEVSDTQLVTFVFPDADPRYQSFRVTPGVTKIVAGSDQWFDCAVEPMTVTVNFAELPNASKYHASPAAIGGSMTSGPGPKTFDVRSCEPTFDLLTYASGAGSEIIGYELFEGLAFVPGGQLELNTSTNSIQRSSLGLEVTGLEGATSVSGSANWGIPPYLQTREGSDSFIATPPAVVAWSFAPIAPGGPGVGETLIRATVGFEPPPGACISEFGAYLWQSAPGGSQAIDATALAPIEAVGVSGWTLAPGPLGDSVWVSMHLGSAEDAPLWYLLEDPSFATAGPSFPQLPADFPPELLPPTTSPTLYSVGHQDRGATSYAEKVAAGAEDWGNDYRWRNAVYDCR